MSWDSVGKALRDMGFERTRRAVALLPLAAFVFLYGVLALLLDPSWRSAFICLAVCYLVAFVALGAEWFWARWYCMGLAYSGVMVGVFGMVSVGVVPALVIYAALHALIVLMLRGGKVAKLYEGQTAWRERFGLDEHAVSRLGKTVSRTSASLPSLVLWALAPKQPEQLSVLGLGGVAGQALVVLALGLASLGLYALVRGRSLGACALVTAAVCAVVALALGGAPTLLAIPALGAGFGWAGGSLAPLLLAAAVAPLMGPLAAYLRGH